MNRLALHESVAPGLPPHELIGIAQASGFDSVGLRVAHSVGADRWWVKGAGAEELRAMVERLLVTRISVLDVGRAELDPNGDAATESVLDLASRLGARYVTVVPGVDVDRADVTRLFADLVGRADPYGLVPLLISAADTAVATVHEATDVARAAGGGVLMDLSVSVSAEEIEDTMLRAGNRLGYLRVQCEKLDAAAEAELAGKLATVPVHVPVAVGSGAPAVGGSDDLAARAARWRSLIDRMLEHPKARAAREAG